MALKVPTSNGPQLFKTGYTISSGLEEAVLRNIQAVAQVSDLVRTSFGPHGHNKIIINHLEKTFVTNDAATILRELEVVHPAGKVIVLASQFLKKAEHLLLMGLHPSEIIQGYELAKDKAQEVLPSKFIPFYVLVVKVSIPASVCNEAATVLQDYIGRDECRDQLGGSQWWQRRLGTDGGIPAEWIAMKKDWSGRDLKHNMKQQAQDKSGNDVYQTNMDDQRCLMYIHGEPRVSSPIF